MCICQRGDDHSLAEATSTQIVQLNAEKMMREPNIDQNRVWWESAHCHEDCQEGDLVPIFLMFDQSFELIGETRLAQPVLSRAGKRFADTKSSNSLQAVLAHRSPWQRYFYLYLRRTTAWNRSPYLPQDLRSIRQFHGEIRTDPFTCEFADRMTISRKAHC